MFIFDNYSSVFPQNGKKAPAVWTSEAFFGLKQIAA